MDDNQKIELWLEFAKQNKIRWSYRRPPIDYINQKLGITRIPIVFWSFPKTLVIMGSYFAIVWGLLMYFTIWRAQGLSMSSVLTESTFAGFFFGLYMAWLYARTRKKFNLTTWDNFPPKL
jgi:hypothetical protein